MDQPVVQIGPSFLPCRVPAPQAKKEALHPPHGCPPVVLEVLADSDQVTEGFLLRGPNPDGGEFAGPVQAGQVPGVEAVGLDPPAGPTGDEDRSDDVARHAEEAQ